MATRGAPWSGLVLESSIAEANPIVELGCILEVNLFIENLDRIQFWNTRALAKEGRLSLFSLMIPGQALAIFASASGADYRYFCPSSRGRLSLFLRLRLGQAIAIFAPIPG